MHPVPKNPEYIQKYLHNIDWQVKENANMSYSLQGMRNYISSEVTKEYWLNHLYPIKIKEAHKSGDLHIHDLGELNGYCCGWDLQDLLRLGFGGVEAKTSSKPAKHFGSALGQVVNFIYTLQGETAGAQAFSNFDTLLAPFIYYDKLSYTEVKQAIQQFVFNVNIPTRVGFQTPFFNITLDINPPSYLANECVIIGGVYHPKKYIDFQPEMDMLNQAFAEVMTEGDASGRIFTFPIPTYNISKDFDWDDDRYDSIWKMTAKYGIPYFANYVNSDMNPEDARSMCCRLRLDNRELNRRGGGLFGSNPLTGSIGVVTINLPRLAYLSRVGRKKELYNRLDAIMDTAKESLEIKRKVIEEMTNKGLYPYSKYYLSGVKQKQGTYWGNHFSTIGIVGMNEFSLNFIDKDITTPQGQLLASEILEYMRDKILSYQEETGNLYNLEATPAEGTAYRLAKLDIEQFGDKMYFANQASVLAGKPPYYTNSSQLPVGYTQDLFEALELQDDLQTKYTGGTVFHGFIGEQVTNPYSVKCLIKKITQNYHLPYLTLTPTFSICNQHGYLSGEVDNCPKCQSTCEIYSRVVGYIRPVDQWNTGKKEEFADRKEFVL